MKTTKKSLSVILSLLMIISTLTALPFTAHALDESGQCGENVTWSFNSSTGKLTISGTGDMYDYVWNYDDGWADSPFYQNYVITNIVINSGVTSIGSYAFYGCESLTSITI
ncbi:MAG: leucine-rich repeat protein, partial [Eubacterium sp.]|nr:leucine-rich repeat protein [Eubacterium sp.]